MCTIFCSKLCSLESHRYCGVYGTHQESSERPAASRPVPRLPTGNLSDIEERPGAFNASHNIHRLRLVQVLPAVSEYMVRHFVELIDRVDLGEDQCAHAG